MQASPFFLRTLAATGGLSLLSLVGVAQVVPQPGALPVPTAPATTTNSMPGTRQTVTPARPATQPGTTPAVGQPAPLLNGNAPAGSGGAASQYPMAVGLPTGSPVEAFPTDTVRLTLEQAQARFMQTNFQLLAQHFNIDIANAAVRQALLRDNPTFFAEVNAFNPETSKFFPFSQEEYENSTGGTVVLQVQKLFDISGQRQKLAQYARTGAAVQQAAFEDVLRQTRYQLTQSFYNVLATRRKLSFTEQERQQLGRLLASYRERLRLGAVAGYEVTRLELEQQTLERDRADLLNQLTQDQATLRVLLAAPGAVFVDPTGVAQLPAPPASIPGLDELREQAYALRPDLRVAAQQTAYSQQNLTVQRSLAVPKLMMGVNYTRIGNTYNNYLGLQTGIDLPTFNRNQGNIQAAKVGVQQATVAAGGVRLQVEQDVVGAYTQLQQAIALRQTITPDYLTRIANVSRDAAASYNSRLIDIVSFIDKFRAYKDAQLNLVDISNRLLQAEQQVNFVTNAKVF